MKSFAGRKAVVTGASRGIGKAVAMTLAAHGARVIGTYGKDSKAAEACERQCRTDGLAVELIRCDVADYKAVGEFFQHLEERFETIDILVNNAGIRRDALAALMDHAQWQEVLDTNLTGTFNMAKHAIILMLKQKYGRIINITSPAAHLGIQGQANYAASKAGQIGLARTLAKEVARKKITVNCVSPGFIKTDFINDLTPEQLSEYKKTVPMRRFGTVEEVADAVLFLASEQASYITGTTLEITGGL